MVPVIMQSTKRLLAFGAAYAMIAVTATAAQFTRITEGPHVTDASQSVGASWIDYDDDGYLDILVANHGLDAQGQNNLLYRNLGDGTFEMITGQPIVDDHSTTESSIWGDFDNDGDLDVILASWYHPNKLYLNDGTGNFAMDPSNQIDDGTSCSSNANWVDYDTDGDLDMFITNPTINNGGYDNNTNSLYRNDAGYLTKILTGDIVTDIQHSYAASWCDFDNDGDPDVVVTPNNEYIDFYRNDGNDLFVRLTSSVICQTHTKSFGGSWGDYDNDGDMDLFVPNWVAESHLFENNGDGTFTVIIGHGLGGAKCISGVWADYDNDGDLDMFAFVSADGVATDARLYENDGNGNFTRIEDGAIATDDITPMAATWGDYDRDGFLDLYLAEYDPSWDENVTNSLYQNNGNANNWITIKPIGTASNRSAIGTKVRAKVTILGSPVWQMRELTTFAGRHSQGPLELHFGLADATIIDSILVEWPSGYTDTLLNIDVNQFLVITEGQTLDLDGDGIRGNDDNCPWDYNPGQEDSNGDGTGDVCCCLRRVGNANGLGGDEPTIGDVSTMIDALFIGGDPAVIACLAEADINQSGNTNPQPSDITIGDISTLIDYLFITGPTLGLADCLSDQQPLEIPYGSAVNIDGVMEEGEWDDASVALSSVPGAVEATIYAKHDGANLLVAFRYSFAGDEEVWVPEVLLDIDYDQASDWQDDDWWIHVSAQDCAISGAYDIWTVCAIVQPDWEAVPNFATFPYTVPLDFFEIRFPLSKMNLSVGSMIGVAFRLRYGTVATEGYWPPTAVIANPSTWGTAILKTQNPASSLKGAHRK